MEPSGETAVVRASVPMAEMLTYESSLRSMTGGRGGYAMEFSHYEESGLPGREDRQGAKTRRRRPRSTEAPWRKIGRDDLFTNSSTRIPAVCPT